MVGELLKKAREESGKDLKEISEILKIRYDYLRAIEEGDFSLLPEEVYIKGYIREYAELLHIDPETALSAYSLQRSPPQDDKGETPAKVPSEQKKIKTSYILVPLAVIIAGFLLMMLLHGPEKESEKVQAPSQTENHVPSSVSTIPEEKPQMSVETEEVTVPPHTAPLSEKPHDTVTKEKNNSTVTKTLHTLKIVAIDTVWLLLNTDNSPPQEMTLKPDETVTFEGQEGFSVKLGNAGGVKIFFDGKDLGKLGGKGQVITLNLP